MATKMNDFVLQQLLAENQRLKQELESSKEAIKVSEACKFHIDFINKTDEPLDKVNSQGIPNEYQKDPGCCLIL
ncbi:guanine nucleotide-binding protein subunit gamma [Acrasis kona]|uniref:Guanine nucleotide-binding protein subunit gamma n=1 Tax=Acrasis kona TaxID=1008807 RepID=A0AAW2ZLP3_9EUKA